MILLKTKVVSITHSRIIPVNKTRREDACKPVRKPAGRFICHEAAMQTVYKLNTDELNTEFLESIKTLFPHKTIEVFVHEADDESLPAKAVRLQPAKFSRFPDRLKMTRYEMAERRPEYQTLAVDEIVMPSRDERYER